MSDISILLAFGAGFLSFISPCVLPLFPAFLSYITGMSVSEITEDNNRLNRNSILHTVFFLIGFSSIFIMIGFSANLISDYLMRYQDIIREIGSILIIFFGLVIVGILNFQFLMKNRKITFKNRPSGFFGSFLIGITFSMGWTPCIGPILTIVFSLTATNPGYSMILMIAYILGFAIPFIVLAIFIGKVKWIKKHSLMITKIGGYIMILVGIALFFDWLTALTSYLAELTGFYGF